MPYADAGQPFSERRAVPARPIPGTCPCCNGGPGLRPLYVCVNGKPTGELRTDPETGRPLARLVLICNHDYDAKQAHMVAVSADAEWKAARKARLAAERQPTENDS